MLSSYSESLLPNSCPRGSLQILNVASQLQHLIGQFTYSMIFTFLKAEIKTRQKQQHRLDITISAQGKQCGIKMPRRVREQVANFYGEKLEVEDHVLSCQIIVKDLNEKPPEIMAMVQFHQEQQDAHEKPRKKYAIQQNQSVKLFYYWEVVPMGRDSQLSRQKSEFSMDLNQFETPEKPKQEQLRESLRIYSPLFKSRQTPLHISKKISLDIIDYLPSPSESGVSKKDLIRLIPLEIKDRAHRVRPKTDRVMNRKQTQGETLNLSFLHNRNPKSTSPSPKKKQTLRSRRKSQISRVGIFIIGSFSALVGLTAGALNP